MSTLHSTKYLTPTKYQKIRLTEDKFREVQMTKCTKSVYKIDTTRPTSTNALHHLIQCITPQHTLHYNTETVHCTRAYSALHYIIQLTTLQHIVHYNTAYSALHYKLQCTTIQSTVHYTTQYRALHYRLYCATL